MEIAKIIQFSAFLTKSSGVPRPGTILLPLGLYIDKRGEKQYTNYKYDSVLWGDSSLMIGKGECTVKRRMLRAAASFLLAFTLLICALPLGAHAVCLREFLDPELERESLSDEQREENLLIITDFLRTEMQLPDSAVAAILANMDRESSLNPRAIDESGNFFGLCQWSRTRWLNCFHFCRENGLDRFSVEGQLAFLQYELSGEYEWVYTQFLVNAEDCEDGAQDAQYAFCLHFEAPLDMEWEQVIRSKLVAEVYWPMISEGELMCEEETPADPESLTPAHASVN